MTEQRDTDPTASQGLQLEPFRYAVIDLASAPSLRPMVSTMTSPLAETLFDSKFPRELLQVGPWLVRLSKAPEVDNALTGMAADVPWGYYIHSTSEIVGLRQSLRRLNLVRLPDSSQEVLFRYWDPRVMDVYLRVMTQHQRTRFFEFIDRIHAPNDGFDVYASGKSPTARSGASTDNKIGQQSDI